MPLTQEVDALVGFRLFISAYTSYPIAKKRIQDNNSKGETFKKFTRTIHKAKRKDPDLDNSTFLDSLLVKRK